MTGRLVFRVFLSSPGDVQPEREAAERVVRRLSGIYSAHVDLRLERWEPRFYEATKSFQQQIESTADFDLVVAILWKRIGTELPPDLFRRPAGSAFESGTVLEIESALESSAGSGRPAVFVFRKTAPVVFSKEHFEQEKRQSDLLDAWWNRTFRDEAGRFRRASEGFETPQAFETRLEDLLVAQLQQRGLIPSGAVWDIDVRGSPYPGLQPYDRDRRSVFFGRDLAVQDAVDDLRQAASREDGLPALFVIGPSGSGKSSLTRAGIAPSLTDPGTVREVDLWRTVTIEMDAGALVNLGGQIYSTEALPESIGSPQKDAAAWSLLAAVSPADAADGIAWALDRVAEAEQRRTGTDRKLAARLLLVVDQLERVFGTEDAGPLSKLLRAMVESGRVWMIATSRSDRYADLQRDPNLLELKRRGAVYDLPAPGEAEITDAVKGPARAAGLVFELGERDGRTLPRALVDDTPGADALPLLQMTLRRLFEARDGSTLTWKAYQEMGGVPGAIAAHADAVFEAVSPAARRELPDLAGRLVRDVARDASGRIRFVATAAEAGWVSTAPRRELAERMVASRLLVRDEPDPNRTVLRSAHEALLRQWRPARAALEAIADRALRRARLVQFGAVAASIVFLGVSLAAGWFWWDSNRKAAALEIASATAQEEARKAQNEAQNAREQLDRANRALAHSIWSDFDFRDQKSLSVRQRNALWSLVKADRGVQHVFVTDLISRPDEEMLRFSYRSQLISRALGLEWPSQAQAAEILSAIIAALLRNTNSLQALGNAAQELTGKLNETQVYQAFSQLLHEMDQTAERGSLGQMGRLLQTITSKLTGAQTEQALTSLLAQMDQASDIYEFRFQMLSQAVHTIAVRLSGPDAQRALVLLLRKVGQVVNAPHPQQVLKKGDRNHDVETLQNILRRLGFNVRVDGIFGPDTENAVVQFQQGNALVVNGSEIGPAVWAALRNAVPLTPAALDSAAPLGQLAQVMESLTARLTETQAEQTLAPLVQQIGQLLQHLDHIADPDALWTLAQGVRVLSPKLSDVDAQQALEPLLQQIEQATEPLALWSLIPAVHALGVARTEEQARQAFLPLVKRIEEATNTDAVRTLAQVVQALAANLTEVQTQQALRPVLRQIDETTNATTLQELAEAVQALAPKLTEAQAQEALGPLVRRIDETTNDTTLQKLAEAVQALAPELTEAQAQEAFGPMVRRIGETTNAATLQKLAEAVQTLASKLTESQAQQALAPLLRQISETSDAGALHKLAEAVQTLTSKLTEAPAQQAFAPLLQQISETSNADALQGLGEAVQVLASKLTEAQAQQALTSLLQQIGETPNAQARRGLVQLVQELATKLTDPQAQQALAPLLQQVSETTTDDALRRLAHAVQALPTKLTGPQAEQVVSPLLNQIDLVKEDLYDPQTHLAALAEVLQALAPKLPEPQAQQALIPLLEWMGKTSYDDTRRALARAVQALPTKLTGPQAEQVVSSLLNQIDLVREDLYDPQTHLAALAEVLQALAPKLPEPQAQQALIPLLEWIGKTSYDDTRRALARAVTALVAKLAEAQAAQALASLLQQIGEQTKPDALGALAQVAQALAATETAAQEAFVSLLPQIGRASTEALRDFAPVAGALAAKVTDAQARPAVDQLLQQIKKTTNANVLQALSQVMLALAPKLTEVELRPARDVVGAKLAWAETEAEAEEWARSLALVLPRKMTAREVREVVTVLGYPTSSGPATDALLGGLREKDLEAPGEYSDLPTFLSWIRRTYPEIQLSSSPECPAPFQPDLVCP